MQAVNGYVNYEEFLELDYEVVISILTIAKASSEKMEKQTKKRHGHKRHRH